MYEWEMETFKCNVSKGHLNFVVCEQLQYVNSFKCTNLVNVAGFNISELICK